ncbi:MAG: STAS domain-containing protein [Pseudomonadota bacterium]
MDYAIEAAGDVARVKLSGRLTFKDHRAYRDLLTELLGHKAKSYEIDLSGVEHIDSAGIGMLMISKQKAEAADGKVVLVAPPPTVKRVLEVAKIDEILDIRD